MPPAHAIAWVSDDRKRQGSDPAVESLDATNQAGNHRSSVVLSRGFGATARRGWGAESADCSVLAWFKRNLAEPPRVDDVAASAHMSLSTFRLYLPERHQPKPAAVPETVTAVDADPEPRTQNPETGATAGRWVTKAHAVQPR